jgi:hypothetical protein
MKVAMAKPTEIHIVDPGAVADAEARGAARGRAEAFADVARYATQLADAADGA